MTLRLSDLLERIRPAGAPGASSDGEPRRDGAELEELGELARALERIEAEADEIIAAARDRAAAVRASGDERARRLRAEIPDRVAAADAERSGDPALETDTDLAAIVGDGAREIERRRADAERIGADLVARAVDTIWQVAR